MTSIRLRWTLAMALFSIMPLQWISGAADKDGGFVVYPEPHSGPAVFNHMPGSDIVFTLGRMDPVRFSHVKHLSAGTGGKAANATGFSCRDCHPVPFDRKANAPFDMEVPHESGGCAQCHNGQKLNGRTVFAATTRCLTCHRSTDTPP